MDKVKDLETLISSYSESYYSGESEISDEEFDSLMDQLRDLSPNSKVLTSIGHGHTPDQSLYTHSFTVGSLPKVKIRDLEKRSDVKELMFTMTPKLDGGSFVLYFKDSKPDRFVSRGNGKVGQDRTKNFSKVQWLDKHKDFVRNDAAWSLLKWVRGEVVISWDSFEKIGGSHPRNRANGLMNSSNDSDDLLFCEFIVYDCNVEFENYYNKLDFLSSIGFKTVPYEIMTLNYLNSNIEKYDYNTSRTWDIRGVSYPLDGVVAKDKNHHLALKFTNESAETTITKIHYQMSRTGRLVPVAEFESVNLDGANIYRATLNNFAYARTMQCGVGSRVRIIRSNQIIPQVESVISPVDVEFPKDCPRCQEPLVQYKSDLLCKNDQCPCNSLPRLRRFLSHVAPKGLGNKVIDEVISSYDITEVSQIFQMGNDPKSEDILSKYSPSTYKKVSQMINSVTNRKYTITEYISNLNLPNFGHSSSLRNDQKYSSDEFYELVMNDDTFVPESCDSRGTESFLSNIKMIREGLESLGKDRLCNSEIIDQDSDDVTKICITGKLSTTKNQFVQQFDGKVIQVSVKDADYIITDDLEGSSSKMKLARSLDKTIITEEQFLEILNSTD